MCCIDVSISDAFFCVSVVPLWNSLPSTIPLTSSAVTFKCLTLLFICIIFLCFFHLRIFVCRFFFCFCGSP